jgi:hypothetical protein
VPAKGAEGMGVIVGPGIVKRQDNTTGAEFS